MPEPSIEQIERRARELYEADRKPGTMPWTYTNPEVRWTYRAKARKDLDNEQASNGGEDK